MIEKQIIIDIVSNLLEGSSIFLVDVVVSPANEIEVEIDSVNRVSIDDCSTLSRSIEAELDREKEDFSLTVFSSGIGYPFKVFRQYQKAIGKMVEVKNNDGTKISGIMEKCEQIDGVVIVTISYELKEKNDGEKRPHLVCHKDEFKILCGVSVKEIITIK